MVVFPVQVTLPDGTSYQRAKLVSGLASSPSSRVYVWDRAAGGARMVAGSDEPVEQLSRTQFRLVTGDGTVLAVKESGCGCSHPLKNWLPERPVRQRR